MKNCISTAVIAGFVGLALCGCGDKREMIGPGTPQYESMKEGQAQMAAIRSGKPTTIHLPAAQKPPPGKEGTPPPPNVTIIYDK